MISFFVPVKTPNPLNTLRHWRKISQERRGQKGAVRLAWYAHLGAAYGKPYARTGARITLTRLGVGHLDQHDGLPASLKAVVDEVAHLLGFDDDNDPRLTFVFRQEKAPRKKTGVRVEVEDPVADTRDPTDDKTLSMVPLFQGRW